jgi:hypothetical protein
MDHIVEATGIDNRAVGTPGHATTEFKHRHWVITPFLSPFPHACAIVACRGEELDPCATCQYPVNRVDDLTVGTESSNALPSSQISICKRVIGRDSVKKRRATIGDPTLAPCG